MQKQNSHNYGLDLLKILSVSFVLMLHVLLFGGILNNAVFLSFNYEIAWLFEIFAFCAVNCYALISGYVGHNTQHKYSRILKIYGQVVFYTMTSFFIYSIVDKSYFTFENFLYALLPWVGNRYWYFNSYFILFFLMPMLNKIVKQVNGKNAIILSIILFTVFSLIPAILPSLSLTNHGYNFIWLSVLYLLGAFCEKYKVDKWIKTKYLVIIWFFSSFTLWALKLMIESASHQIVDDLSIGLSYDSPFILFSAMTLLLIFVKIKVPFKLQKTITVGAKTSFGVYICHMTPIVMNIFILGKLTQCANISPVSLILAIFITILVLFIFCGCVDLFRGYIFERISKGLKSYRAVKN